MKHYIRLWSESPGAMLWVHVVLAGLGACVALVGRNPVKSGLALLATGLAAWAILPICVAWNIKRTRGG